MQKNTSKILCGGMTFLFLFFVLYDPFSGTSLHRLGLPTAFADHLEDHDTDYDPKAGCAKNGRITLDSSKSSSSGGGGTVWSNTPLEVGQNASKNDNVSLRTIQGLNTVINTPGTNQTPTPLLMENSVEFTASTEKYTDLKGDSYTGGIDPLTYFDSSSGQLFDFARYKAAAAATGNLLTWDEFETKVENGETMYGIVHVTLDTVLDGKKKLETGSVNIKGTLVIDLINATSDYKMFVKVPLNINPVISPTTHTTTLSPTDFNNWTHDAKLRESPTDPFPWPSGYEAGWNSVASYSSGAKDPRGKSLSGGHESFGANEDMPAMIYSGGIVDIHHDANISGVVYTPDFVEIEQKKRDNEVQYITGAVIGGGGMYLESNTCGGGIAVVFDPDTLDSLKVTATPSSLKKAAWKID